MNSGLFESLSKVIDHFIPSFLIGYLFVLLLLFIIIVVEKKGYEGFLSFIISYRILICKYALYLKGSCPITTIIKDLADN